MKNIKKILIYSLFLFICLFSLRCDVFALYTTFNVVFKTETGSGVIIPYSVQLNNISEIKKIEVHCDGKIDVEHHPGDDDIKKKLVFKSMAGIIEGSCDMDITFTTASNGQTTTENFIINYKTVVTGKNDDGGTTTPPGNYTDLPGLTITDPDSLHGEYKDEIFGWCEYYAVEGSGYSYVLDESLGNRKNTFLYTAEDRCDYRYRYENRTMCVSPDLTSSLKSTAYRFDSIVDPTDGFDVISNVNGSDPFAIGAISAYKDEIVSSPGNAMALSLAIKAYVSVGELTGKFATTKVVAYKAYREYFETSDASKLPSGISAGNPVVAAAYKYYQAGKAAAANPDSLNPPGVRFDRGEALKECDTDGSEISKGFTFFADGNGSYTIIKLALYNSDGAEVDNPGFELKIVQGSGLKGASVSTISSGLYTYVITGSRELWNSVDPKLEFGFEVDTGGNGFDFHDVALIVPMDRTDYQKMIIIRDGTKENLIFRVGKLGELSTCSCFVDEALKPGSSSFDKNLFKESGCCNDPNIVNFASNPEVKAICEKECEDPCVDTNWNTKSCDTNIFIHEGITKDPDAKNANQINYEKCVLDVMGESEMNDIAGNTRMLEGFEDNEFCKVYCKEDWDFEMPGPKTVAAGRYFDLSLPKVQGVRTCVTSFIKHDQIAAKGGNEFGSESFEYRYKNINEKLAAYSSAYQAAIAAQQTVKDHLELRKGVCTTVNCIFDSNTNSYNPDTPHQDSKEIQVSNIRIASADPKYKFSIVLNTSQHLKFNNQSGEVLQNFDWKIKDDQTYLSGGYHGETFGLDWDYKGDFGYNSQVKNIPDNNCFGGMTCDWSDFKDYTHDPAWKRIETAVNTYPGIIAQLLAEREKIVKDIQQCTEWMTDEKYDYNWVDNSDLSPEVTYTYFEDYYMSQVKGKNEYVMVSKEQYNTNPDGLSDSKYSFGLYDGGLEYSDDNRPSYNIHFDEGEETEGSYRNTLNGIVVSGNKPLSGSVPHVTPYYSSMYKVQGYIASYKTRGVWYALHGSGDVTWEDGEGNPDDELYLNMKNINSKNVCSPVQKGAGYDELHVLPVRITSGKGEGVGDYELRFLKIGMFNDSGETGRLIGGTNNDKAAIDSVFTALKNGATVCAESKFGYSKFANVGQTYMCNITIKHCNDTACLVDDLNLNIISLLDCPIGYCKDAPSSYVADDGDPSYIARTVSLSDLNPNDREMGWNWCTDTYEKGYKACNEIEAKGDNIFNETPEYSYKISPAGMAAIRETNKDYSYSDFRLSCGVDGDPFNCESAFLNTLDTVKGVTQVYRNGN